MTAAVEDVRVCRRPGCEAPLVRRDNEGATNWKARQYCTKECSWADRGAAGRARARNRVGVLDDRRCAWAGCGGPLQRRRGERTADWLSRRFCSQKCNESRFRPVKVAKPVFPAVVDERDQSWRPQAACLGANPNRFGPIEQHEKDGMDRCRRAAAEFCRRCPVAAACHQYAEQGDEQGVWSGRLRQNRNGRVTVERLFGPAPAEAKAAS